MRCLSRLCYKLITLVLDNRLLQGLTLTPVMVVEADNSLQVKYKLFLKPFG